MGLVVRKCHFDVTAEARRLDNNDHDYYDDGETIRIMIEPPAVWCMALQLAKSPELIHRGFMISDQKSYVQTSH